MSDVFDGFDSYEPMGDDNPFLGKEGFDSLSDDDSKYSDFEQEVLDSFGIESFDSIFITASERDLENARGNRFETIAEAIVYLFDSGILQFSGVVLDDDLFGESFEVEIDADTGGSTK